MHPRKRITAKPPSNSWLWWLALFILSVGGSLTYLFSQKNWDPEARMAMSISIVLTSIGTGICVICATANWWIHR